MDGYCLRGVAERTMGSLHPLVSSGALFTAVHSQGHLAGVWTGKYLKGLVLILALGRGETLRKWGLRGGS